MNSKKEEERNEKIIRGLMKLPPNRRCINCNSLGPQYVCTNFWTFICTTCSGIHREFTHRVKSVSMAKFTSQEVEALQEGGNQRARETFLKDWDPQRQKQPNNSDAEKVREFIKHVYVDRKYARGKISDKPPRDAQNLRHPGEETRRASSYHSYSQSPPYDYQYEERQYRRQLPALTRKPGSDRGCYDGKVPNFSSLSSFSDQTFEDRFANEGSNPRASDYSVSSPGDPFRSDNQSPNFQQDVKCTSPPYQTADTVNQKVQNQITNSFLESNIKENAERARRTQRATSSGSFGSFDSTSMSLQSVSSVTSADLVSGSGPEQPAEIHQDKQYADSSLPQRSTSSNFGGLDLFNTPAPLHTVTPSLTVDLFQLPGAQPRPPIDLFEPSSTLSAPELNGQLSTKTIPSSLDFSQLPRPLPPVTLDKGSPNEVISKNEGWATFDFPQHTAPNQRVVHPVPLGVASNGGYLEKVDQLLLPSTGTQWPAFEGISAHEPSSVHNLWHGELYQSHASVTNTQHSWDAFEDPTRRHPYSGMHQGGDEVAGQAPSTTMDQPLSEFNKEGFQRMVFNSRPPIPRVPIRVEAQAHAIDRKSSNPFDISDDSDFECSSTFPNMASLQAALPSGLLPDSMVNDVTQSWLSHNPFPHYIPAAQQGALGFMGGQALSTQMPTVPAQEPVASVGGNPFA